MRIVAGKHRSRQIKSVPTDKTRPTLDQVKESLFQRIGPYFDGGSFLDLFAGSGNIGLEALSRGINHVTFVDNQIVAIKTINENIKSLKEEANTKVLMMSYEKAILSLDSSFDWIYCDPPYDFQQYTTLLSKLVGLLNEGGTILVEMDKKTSLELPESLQLVNTYTYRSATIYRLEK